MFGSKPFFESSSTPASSYEKRHQSCLTLKLCKSHEDVVVIDGDNAHQGPVKCAKEYEDGTLESVAVLGRNHFTGIVSPNVSRAICEVSLKLIQPTSKPQDRHHLEVVACIAMRKQGGHQFCIDGELVDKGVGVEIPINHGSVISLHDNGFAYMIQIVHGVENGTGTAEAEGKSRAETSAKKIVEKSSTCALCLEIMVYATLSYPCIHHFCQSCTLALRSSVSYPKCPLCRSNVVNWMPGRGLDDMIWANALLGCYDQEYAQTYLERREEHMNLVPSKEQKKLILKLNV